MPWKSSEKKKKNISKRLNADILPGVEIFKMEGNYCTYVRHTSEQGEMGEAVAMDYKDLIEMVSPTKVISLRSI